MHKLTFAIASIGQPYLHILLNAQLPKRSLGRVLSSQRAPLLRGEAPFRAPAIPPRRPRLYAESWARAPQTSDTQNPLLTSSLNSPQKTSSQVSPAPPSSARRKHESGAFKFPSKNNCVRKSSKENYPTTTPIPAALMCESDSSDQQEWAEKQPLIILPTELFETDEESLMELQKPKV